MEVFGYFTLLALILALAAYAQVNSRKKEIQEIKDRLDRIRPAK